MLRALACFLALLVTAPAFADFRYLPKVTDFNSGQPITGTRVDVFSAASEVGPWTLLADVGGVVDANGEIAITLPTGRFLAVRFVPNDGRWPQYWSYVSCPTQVPCEPTGATGAVRYFSDAWNGQDYPEAIHLYRPGYIVGSVKQANGMPVANAMLRIFRGNEQFDRRVAVPSDGSFRIHVPYGDVRVAMYAPGLRPI